MSQARASKMNHAPVLIPLFRGSIKIAVLLQLLIIGTHEWVDSRIHLDVLRQGVKVAVLQLCDLRTNESHFGLTLCHLRVQDTVIVALDALGNDTYRQPESLPPQAYRA